MSTDRSRINNHDPLIKVGHACKILHHESVGRVYPHALRDDWRRARVYIYPLKCGRKDPKRERKVIAVMGGGIREGLGQITVKVA
jgi:hypothetical protein